jgi:hypothetical protein
MILLHLQILDQIGLVAIYKVLFVAVRRLFRMLKHLIEPDGVVKINGKFKE